MIRLMKGCKCHFQVNGDTGTFTQRDMKHFKDRQFVFKWDLMSTLPLMPPEPPLPPLLSEVFCTIPGARQPYFLAGCSFKRQALNPQREP